RLAHPFHSQSLGNLDILTLLVLTCLQCLTFHRPHQIIYILKVFCRLVLGCCLSSNSLALIYLTLNQPLSLSMNWFSTNSTKSSRLTKSTENVSDILACGSSRSIMTSVVSMTSWSPRTWYVCLTLNIFIIFKVYDWL